MLLLDRGAKLDKKETMKNHCTWRPTITGPRLYKYSPIMAPPPTQRRQNRGETPTADGSRDNYNAQNAVGISWLLLERRAEAYARDWYHSRI